MMRTLTHYQVLELSESASSEMIHAAWKLLMTKNHPDKGGDEGTARAINAAYQVLKDPEKRGMYDAELRASRQPIPVPTPQNAYGPAYPAAYPMPTFNLDALAKAAAQAVIDKFAADNPFVAELLKTSKRRKAG
jgi:curved DNA-binding protein CbpA